MKQFKDLFELNKYANENPKGIADINIGINAIEYLPENYSLEGGPPKKHMCYIVFMDKKSYDNYLSKNIVEGYLPSINAVQTEVTMQEFNDLRNMYDVKYIDFINEDQTVEPTLIVRGVEYSDWFNWGAEHSDIPHAWSRGYTGKGVKIGIIDTYFENVGDLIYEEIIDLMVGDLDVTIKEHGTKVAGTIGCKLDNSGSVGMAYDSKLYGIATGLKLISIRQGIQWSIDNGMDIINMSFASGPDQVKEDLLNVAESMGIISVAGSGNGQTDPDAVRYPANYDSVVSVGAVAMHLATGELEYPSFKPYNNPGVEFIYSGVNVSTIGLNGMPIKFSGTSASSPGIASYFAILKEEFPDKTKQELIDIMKIDALEVEGMYGVFPMYENDLKCFTNVNGEIKKINKIQTNVNGEIKTIVTAKVNPHKPI